MSGDARGFTLIEMLIVATILLPLLGAVATTSGVISSSVETNSRSADVTTSLRRTVNRVAAFVRPGKLSTIKVPAVQQDVDLMRASKVGEWIDPTDLVWRPGLELKSASGLLSMNAALNTSPRRLTFLLDPRETDNDIDDDGDGLIDEGRLMLMQGTTTVAVITDLEVCAFALDDRILKMRFAVGRRDSKGRVYRAVVEQSYYMRNN